MDGLKEWQGNLTEVTGKIPSLEAIKTNPDKVIETAAANIDAVGDVQKALNTDALQQSEYGKIVKNIEDPEAMKKLMVEKAKQEALNHLRERNRL